MSRKTKEIPEMASRSKRNGNRRKNRVRSRNRGWKGYKSSPNRYQKGLDEIKSVMKSNFSDFRDLGDAASQGNERAQLALDMFHYQVRKLIGALAVAMEGVDVITFTAGVGENGIEDRAAICQGLEFLGAKLDPERNNVRGKDTLISTDDSTVKMYVIPTNEEIMIARDTKDIVSNL